MKDIYNYLKFPDEEQRNHIRKTYIDIGKLFENEVQANDSVPSIFAYDKIINVSNSILDISNYIFDLSVKYFYLMNVYDKYKMNNKVFTDECDKLIFNFYLRDFCSELYAYKEKIFLLAKVFCI